MHQAGRRALVAAFWRIFEHLPAKILSRGHSRNTLADSNWSEKETKLGLEDAIVNEAALSGVPQVGPGRPVGRVRGTAYAGPGVNVTLCLWFKKQNGFLKDPCPPLYN